ncbi:LamG-like jellyroll fold domain-containing protein [Paraliomyxa miuraensis]|uniref:LamG-like jellyroll fold domain-containing protein n=1 Tax=Paraliomyxa miuraensis TaxID=376150 RepID=UPI00225498F0|nr:LamG-like jellyroll fold domain-containing protein [Paraliomyxa miuraensis]MCX4243424.1 hypothetical protein [Paraliomyxa miuraensis]
MKSWKIGALVAMASGAAALGLTPTTAHAEGLSCAGACTGQVVVGAESCFCDDACMFLGDCCDDYTPQACAPSSSSSCEGHCGGNAGSCYCDDLCTGYGDCCADYEPVCVEIYDDYHVEPTSMGLADEVGMATTRYGTRIVSIDPQSAAWTATDARSIPLAADRSVVYTSMVRWHHDAALANLQRRASQGEDVQDQIDRLSPQLDWLRVNGPQGQELSASYDLMQSTWSLGRDSQSVGGTTPMTQGEWHALALQVRQHGDDSWLILYVDGEAHASLFQAGGESIEQWEILIGGSDDQTGTRAALETGPLYVIEGVPDDIVGFAELQRLWNSNQLLPEPGLLGSWPLLDCFYGGFGEVPVETTVDTSAFPSCTRTAQVEGCSQSGCAFSGGASNLDRPDRVFGPGMGLVVAADEGLEPLDAVTFGARIDRAWWSGSLPAERQWIIDNVDQNGGYSLSVQGQWVQAEVRLANGQLLQLDGHMLGVAERVSVVYATYDASTGRFRLLVNGRVLASQTGTPGVQLAPSLSVGLGIGQRSDGTGEFTGPIGDARIYDHVISDRSLAGWSDDWQADLERGHDTWPRHTEANQGQWIVSYDQPSDTMIWAGSPYYAYSNANSWRHQLGVNMIAPPRFELARHESPGYTRSSEYWVEYRADPDADGSLGIIYGYQDDDNFYRFSLGAHAAELTIVRDGVRLKALEEPSLGFPVGPGWGAIRITHGDTSVGRRHLIEIGMHQLEYFEGYPEFEGGQVGLFAEAADNVQFRNLRVRPSGAPRPYEGLTTYVTAEPPSDPDAPPAMPSWTAISVPTPTGTFLEAEDFPYLLMDAICESDRANLIACGFGGWGAAYWGELGTTTFMLVAAILPRSLYGLPPQGEAFFNYFNGSNDRWCAEWSINSNVEINYWCWENKDAWWLDGGPSWVPYGGI